MPIKASWIRLPRPCSTNGTPSPIKWTRSAAKACQPTILRPPFSASSTASPKGQTNIQMCIRDRLERLRESSKELERQKAIKDIELKRSSEEMSKANMDAFKKEFGDDNFSNSDVLDLESKYGDLTNTPTSDLYLAEEGIEGLSAAIIKVQEAKVEAENTGNTDWLASLNERCV